MSLVSLPVADRSLTDQAIRALAFPSPLDVHHYRQPDLYLGTLPRDILDEINHSLRYAPLLHPRVCQTFSLPPHQRCSDVTVYLPPDGIPRLATIAADGIRCFPAGPLGSYHHQPPLRGRELAKQRFIRDYQSPAKLFYYQDTEGWEECEFRLSGSVLSNKHLFSDNIAEIDPLPGLSFAGHICHPKPTAKAEGWFTIEQDSKRLLTIDIAGEKYGGTIIALDQHDGFVYAAYSTLEEYPTPVTVDIYCLYR